MDHPHNKELFSNAQYEPTLAQLCAIPVCSIIDSHGVETSISLCFPSLCNCRGHWGHFSAFFSDRQHKCPQPLLPGHAFHLCHQFSCYPLNVLKYHNIFFILWRPEMHTIFKVSCTSAKYSGRITSFVQFTMLYLMHSKMKFASWLPGHTTGLC